MRNWAVAAVIVLSGCAVGPNYHQPATPLDVHFANAGEPGFAETDAVEQYWTSFTDPVLDGLVADALAHNKDLSAAEANLRAARAIRRLAGFDQFPTVTLAASYTHQLDSQLQLPGVDQHDRDIVPHRVEPVAGHASQAATVGFQLNFGAASRADENLEQISADGHVQLV